MLQCRKRIIPRTMRNASDILARAVSAQVPQCRPHAPLRPWAERPGEVGLEAAITWPGFALAPGPTSP